MGSSAAYSRYMASAASFCSISSSSPATVTSAIVSFSRGMGLGSGFAQHCDCFLRFALLHQHPRTEHGGRRAIGASCSSLSSQKVAASMSLFRKSMLINVEM